MRWILRQCHDLAAYWAVPGLCFLLPARAANAVMRFFCRRDWFYRTHVDNARRHVRGVVDVDDFDEWAYTIRVVRFLDAVDNFHGRFSSDRRIERSLLSVEGDWPETESVVMLGTHLGPGMLSLRRMAVGGYPPRIIYRDITNAQLWRAPFLHLQQVSRIRYMRRVCRGRAIRVPGGSSSVREAVGEAGRALVLVPDAPANSVRGDRLAIFDHWLSIDARGLEMVTQRQVPCSMFTVYWDEAQGRRIMKVTRPQVFKDLEDAVSRYNAFLSEMLSLAPAQWHLWAVRDPVLRDGD